MTSDDSAAKAETPVETRKVKRAGLNRLHRLRYAIIDVVRWYYTRFWGMDLHPTC